MYVNTNIYVPLNKQGLYYSDFYRSKKKDIDMSTDL